MLIEMSPIPQVPQAQPQDKQGDYARHDKENRNRALRGHRPLTQQGLKEGGDEHAQRPAGNTAKQHANQIGFDRAQQIAQSGLRRGGTFHGRIPPFVIEPRRLKQRVRSGSAMPVIFAREAGEKARRSQSPQKNAGFGQKQGLCKLCYRVGFRSAGMGHL